MGKRGKPAGEREARPPPAIPAETPVSEVMVDVLAPAKLPAEYSQVCYLSWYHVEPKKLPAEPSQPTDLREMINRFLKPLSVAVVCIIAMDEWSKNVKSEYPKLCYTWIY